MASWKNRSDYGALEVSDNVEPNQSSKSLRPLALWVIVTLVLAGCAGIYVLTRVDPLPTGFIHNTQMRRMEESHAADVPAKWAEKGECNDDHTFTLTLALKQSNTDRLHEHVMSVSDPAEDTYGRYWTADAVKEYFAPDDSTLKAVTEWLEDSGFSVENGRMRLRSEHGSVVRVDVTCKEANELLDAKYMFYEHTETHKSHLRVKDGVYNIPDAIFEHIDFVEPTMRFPVRRHTRNMEKVELSEDEVKAMAQRKGVEEDYVTPTKLYALYGMSTTLSNLEGGGSTEVKQAVASYLDEYWSDADLQLAWENLGYMGDNDISQMSRVPMSQSQGTGSEAELDTQYITATAPGLDTVVYYVDDDSDPFVTLVEDIMESAVKPTVVSISYGGDEYEMGREYVERCNQEFGKLALMGITILASSGDSGVRGDDNDCHMGSQYIASFPASAPYVTAVGGVSGGSEQKGNTGEVAWMYSGGGFSIFFEEPSWQSDAVSSYFNQDIDFPESERYETGMRGFPDISAQSVDYIIAVGGDWYLVSGTSASCPVVAGMISMINMERVKSGKETLGFLNPAIYSLYDGQSDYNEMFNDITEGYNEGCRMDDDIGWTTAEGWDPITGCGSPKFEELFSKLRDI